MRVNWTKLVEDCKERGFTIADFAELIKDIEPRPEDVDEMVENIKEPLLLHTFVSCHFHLIKDPHWTLLSHKGIDKECFL
jgi:hypothetical protein